MKYQLLLLTFCLILTLTTQAQLLSDDLQAYYKFDNNLTDLTGNGNDLTYVSGNVNYTSVYQNDNVVNFSNSNSLVTINNFNASNYSAYSFSLWIKTATIKNFNQTIFQGASIGFGLHIEANTGEIGGFFSGSSANSYTSNIVVTDNEWHHIVFQCDGNDMYLYIDNVLDGSMPSIALNGSNSLYIGNSNQGNKGYDGAVNELRIYDRMLTECEIKELNRQMDATIDASNGINVIAGDLIINDDACSSVSTISTKNENTKLKIYPNPLESDFLFLEFEGIQELELITIVNATGEVMMRFIPDNRSKFELNTSHLGSGIYYVVVYKKDAIETKQILKL